VSEHSLSQIILPARSCQRCHPHPSSPHTVHSSLRPVMYCYIRPVRSRVVPEVTSVRAPLTSSLVIIIGPGGSVPIATYIETSGSPYPIYGNPSLSLYRLFGFKSNLAGSKKGEEKEYEKALGGMVVRTWSALKKGPFKHLEHASQVGPKDQNGGEMVLEAGKSGLTSRGGPDPRGANKAWRTDGENCAATSTNPAATGARRNCGTSRDGSLLLCPYLIRQKQGGDPIWPWGVRSHFMTPSSRLLLAPARYLQIPR
jgi:hypothetical protein